MTGITQIDDVRWTAAHTKPRCEKRVAEHCAANAIPHYLPLRRRAKRYQRRTVETFLPMFPGYIFVQVNGELKSLLLRSHRVAVILPITRAAERRLVAELNDIQRLEAASLEAELEVSPELVPGTPVAITDGPLGGTHGIVHRRRERTRVTVNVELLGQSVSVDMDVGEVTLETD